MASISNTISNQNEEAPEESLPIIERYLAQHGANNDNVFASSGRLTSIIDQGILSSQALQAQNVSHSSSYDAAPNAVVYLNCITKTAGIQKALFHPADGIISIGLERAGDREWMEKLVDGDDLEKIYNEKLALFKAPSRPSPQPSADLPNILKLKIRERAMQESLSVNDLFLKELSERAHNTAIFVLDLDPISTDSVDDPSGCHDAVRPSIPRNKIKAVILSKEWKDSDEVSRILKSQTIPIRFVDSESQKIQFCYSNGMEKEKMSLTLNIPSFGPALEEFWVSNEDKPLFIHAARI